jgi:hypothetical protein
VSRMNPNTTSTSGVPRGESGTIGADIKWLDLDVLADVTIMLADGVWTAASALRIAPSIDGQPAVARVTELRVASV